MPAPSKSRIKAACEGLALADPALRKAYDMLGPPTWRARTVSYETIATSIAYQQISTHAADAIWGRVKAALPDISAPVMLATPDDTLGTLGLSRPKISHLKSLATAIDTGTLALDQLSADKPEEARAQLLAVRGIGPWTANLFLLFALGDMDAFPAGDVALIEAYRQLAGAEERLTSKAFTAYAERWQPWRGVAAHLLWAWTHYQRGAHQKQTVGS